MSTPVVPILLCRNPDCTVAEGGRCAREAEFPDWEVSCPDLLRSGAGAVAPQVEVPSRDPAPWSGRPLEESECEALLRRSFARVISVLGVHDAGKTCLLTAFFLQLAQGGHDLPFRFASCLTFHGFRELAKRAEQWQGEGDVVGHTPVDPASQGARFLHVGLRPSDPRDDRHIDVVLNDTPGEQVDAFVTHVEAPRAGALQFLPRADGHLVVVDASKLVRDDPRLDRDMGQLIQRVSDIARDSNRRPPIAVVYAKMDRVSGRWPKGSERAQREAWGELGRKSPRIWGAIERGRAVGLAVEVFGTSAFPRPLSDGQPIGLMEPFDLLLRAADARSPWPSLQPGDVPRVASSFEAMPWWRS
jgi:hypothetical protein